MVEKEKKLVFYYDTDRMHFVVDDGCEFILEKNNILENEDLSEYQKDTLERAKGGFKSFRAEHLIYLEKIVIEGILVNRGELCFKCYVCNRDYKITREMYEAKFWKIEE
ncbi:MAG: hypothetical protein GTN38_04240 [Candidatus Aenigmarchaeota archaeon]|nr:hypothetical protein [Candidatus Aenigmarchaeota archaeon]NIP40872.1 hypothetical protein [Candidatus Aenigmarchaeota archaeon]NIQ17986.1 hypothetical protein [Candidatus Aenigmarchaeota archaeon]NIS73575.1 hypothetical protein [Candidatus Aenigmarchaeota archaeon]